jgi:hypothetical protein
MSNAYRLTIDFTTDRKIATEEIENLLNQVIAQVEEPVDEESADTDYSTQIQETELVEII